MRLQHAVDAHLNACFEIARREVDENVQGFLVAGVDGDFVGELDPFMAGCC